MVDLYKKFRYRFSIPTFFFILDYVYHQKKIGNKVRFKIIHAFPSHVFLNTLNKRYLRERNVKVTFKDDGFKPRLREHKSIVVILGKDGAFYPEESMRLKETQTHIKKLTECAFREFLNDDYSKPVNIITRNPQRKWVKRLGSEEKAMERRIGLYFSEKLENPVIGTYGAIRGLNNYKGSVASFLLGNYGINKSRRVEHTDKKTKERLKERGEKLPKEYQDTEIMIDYVREWFCVDPDDKDMYYDEKDEIWRLKTVENKSHGGYYHYTCELAEILRKQMEDDEILHAILQSTTKYIFLLCWHPPEEQMRKEGMDIIHMLRPETCEKNRKWKKWLEDYVREKGKVLTRELKKTMAKQFGISESHAYNQILKIAKKSEFLHRIDNGWIEYYVRNILSENGENHVGNVRKT